MSTLTHITFQEHYDDGEKDDGYGYYEDWVCENGYAPLLTWDPLEDTEAQRQARIAELRKSEDARAAKGITYTSMR